MFEAGRALQESPIPTGEYFGKTISDFGSGSQIQPGDAAMAALEGTDFWPGAAAGKAALFKGLPAIGAMGMTAWHGTPHRWPDTVNAWRKQISTGEHVGTGEGAAAYGWGKLYAAENKGVGEYYIGSNPAVSQPKLIFKDGSEILESEYGDFTTKYASDYLRRTGNDYDKAVDLAKKDGGVYQGEIIEWLDSFRKYGTKTNELGHLYELDIPDEHINKMLDWDKPLSEQPPNVRNALESVTDESAAMALSEKYGYSLDEYMALPQLRKKQLMDTAIEDGTDLSTIGHIRGSIPYYGMKPDLSSGAINKNNPAGNALYESLETKLGGQQAASEYLNSLGIPGTKYLDATSRGKGEGTRNFVIFDENIVTPLSRNGEPITNAMAAPPKASKPKGRMSKAEAEAAGYWHPIGVNKKLPRPINEMSRIVVPYGEIPPVRPIDIESMQGGVLIPASGDRSDAGKLLLGVGDTVFPEPVRLEGGHGFMRENPQAVWASDPGPVTKLTKKARNALAEGRDPYLAYMPMGHTATTFSTMATDTMLEQIRGGNISKTAKLLFDRRLRKLRPEWKGIDHPDAIQQLHDTGALRHAFAEVVNLDDFQKRNFPNVAETRFGITDPDLLDVPLHHGGQAISRLSGEIITDPIAPHKTYKHQMGGEYLGGIPEGVPREILFPDFNAARRATGADPVRDYRSFALQNPTQNIDQEWIDRVMGYIQR